MRTNSFFIAIIFAFLFNACSSKSDEAHSGGLSVQSLADSMASAQKRADSLLLKQDTVKHDTLAPFFRKYGVEGSFLMHDPQRKLYLKHRPEWHNKPMSPASTFKVLNALIALETGAIPDTKTVIPWDGKNREFPHWNQNHNMESAMKGSVVWYYQEVARRIGPKRMQHYINEVGYGNRNIGSKIDQFWLDSTLLVTMENQVSFMRSLHRDALPFSSKTVQTVKNMITFEQKSTYTIRGKTGWRFDQKPQLGWFIGYVVTHPDNKAYYFATAIHINRPEEAAYRTGITVEILKHLGILKEPAPVVDSLQQTQPTQAPAQDLKGAKSATSAPANNKTETKPAPKTSTKKP